MKTLLFVRNKDSDEVIQDDCVKILNVTNAIEHVYDQAAGQGRKARLCINYFISGIYHTSLYTCRENW